MSGRKLNVLYFDLECRPGHWIGGDFVSKVLTAAAWSWGDSDLIHHSTHYETEPGTIASVMSSEIELADMVVGHYIRGFDLPLLNGELLRNSLEPMGQVLALDTKQDLLNVHGRSQSQKNLASMLGVAEPKVDVTVPEWEDFNGRVVGAEKKVIERVRGDVEQNKALREALVEIGWLGEPAVWRPDR